MEQPFVLSRSENLLPFPPFLSQKPSEVFLSFFLLQAESRKTNIGTLELWCNIHNFVGLSD